MNSIRKEEEFKIKLEKLLIEYSSYTNLISFIEDCTVAGDFLRLAQDFAEELSLYETDIEEIFSSNIFDINNDTLDISFNYGLMNNISLALVAIKNLIPNDFEKLCALYIKFLGTTGNPNITRHSHDQGIDFIGIVEKNKKSRLYSAKSSVNNVYLIGQAKHYEKDKVKTNEIRELAGSIYLLKTKGFGLKNDPYSHVTIKSYTPIFVYFITSFYFSESAKQLCLNTDIVPIDRILLALTFGLNKDYQDTSGFFSIHKFQAAISSIDYF